MTTKPARGGRSPEEANTAPVDRSELAPFQGLGSDATRGNADEFAVAFDVIDGPHQGRSIVLTRHESLVAGRDKSCQLHFPDDPHFSRFHFRLEVNPPAARLIDLESRNGTLVNGSKARSVELGDGDEIKAGRTRLRVRLQIPRQVGPNFAATIIAQPPDAPADDQPEMNASPLASPVAPPALPGLHALPGAPGLSIPGYTLEAEIGRGGLGVVYRGRHKATRRPVAIKVILPAKASDAEATQLFLREANVMGQLKHPRIVEFQEFGMSGRQFYLVMELIDRIQPETLWTDMPWPRRVKVACGIAVQALEALEFAHARSFVHRDIKPANLLMSRTGRKLNVKLADFGMAKNFQYAGFSDLTDDRDARGTLAYMSPEQVIDCRFAGPSCDIYAVGVTLYQLLSGDLPFEFTTQRSALAMVLDGTIVPLESRCPGVPTALGQVVRRAMHRDAAERFTSAAELRLALQEQMDALKL